MAKLTRDQRKRIESALDLLDRCQQYIDRPDIHVCRDSSGTTTREFVGPDGRHMVKTAKDIGSPIVFLSQAVRNLRYLIDPVQTDAE